MIHVKKNEGESAGSLIYRFNKSVKHSGVLKEAKKRKFHKRTENRNQRRRSALRRESKRQEILKSRKLGKF